MSLIQRWRATVTIVLIIFAGWLLDLAANLQAVTGMVAELLKGQITPTPTSVGWLPSIVIVIALLVVVLVGLLLDRSRALKEQRTRAAAEPRDRLHAFRRTVYHYVKRQEKPLKYVSVEWTYTCSPDGADFTRFQSVVEADELLIKLHRIGRLPTMDAGGSRATFEDLKFEPFTDEGKRIDAEVVDESPDYFWVALFLDPPIGGKTPQEKRRTIGFTYVWRGLWDPLRSGNFDSGDVTALADSDKTTVKLKFPPADIFGRVKLTERHPERGHVLPGTDESNLQVITWEIGQVRSNEKFEYQLEKLPAGRD